MEKEMTMKNRMGEKLVGAGKALGAALGIDALALAAAPTPAYAAFSAGDALSEFTDAIKGGVTFLGGVLVIFGLVNLGLNLKDGAQGGGGQLGGAIAAIVGGIVVIIAAQIFGQLDTGWAK